MKDVATLLNVARGLVAQEKLDVEEMMELLDCLPIFTFDVPGQGAIVHAHMVAAAALDRRDAIHDMIARCALARVVALLESRMTIAMAVS